MSEPGLVDEIILTLCRVSQGMTVDEAVQALDRAFAKAGQHLAAEQRKLLRELAVFVERGSQPSHDPPSNN